MFSSWQALITPLPTSLLSSRKREDNHAMSGSENRWLNNGGFCRVVGPPRGPGLVCQMGGAPQLSGYFCIGSNHQIRLPESHWPGLVSCQEQSPCPSLRPISSTVSHRVSQKQFVHDISKRGWDLAHLVYFSGFPKDMMTSKPIASQHHRSVCVCVCVCVCVRACACRSRWSCLQTVFHARVSTGVSRCPVNNLVYTTSKWEINFGNYLISSILIYHWL